jgi:putative colanic acid biosynthesis UDP-glucose lipid carrier transferase
MGGEAETSEKMEKRIEHDMYYIQRWSLWFDAKIILLTLLVPLHENAY